MTDENYDESAMRGRYLAVNGGACIECHTAEPEAGPGPSVIDYDRFFQGGRMFPAAAFGLVGVPGVPEMIESSNITSHMEFGIGEYTAEQIVRVLKEVGFGGQDDLPTNARGSHASLWWADR